MQEKKFIDIRQVSEKVGMAKTPIYDRIREGTFPAPIPLGSRCVRWVSSEIENWMAEQIAARASAPPENPRQAKAKKAVAARHARTAAQS